MVYNWSKMLENGPKLVRNWFEIGLKLVQNVKMRSEFGLKLVQPSGRHPIPSGPSVLSTTDLASPLALKSVFKKVAWHCYSCCDPGRDDTGEEQVPPPSLQSPSGRPGPPSHSQSSQPPPLPSTSPAPSLTYLVGPEMSRFRKLLS